MRHILILYVILLLVGCSRGSVVVPDSSPPVDNLTATRSSDFYEPYMLWSEGEFFIGEDHESVDVVPKRAGRLHLNALKFLEEYCSDCVQIPYIQNNGDGTINVTVRITHPFDGHPEFTGFDVKGIIMLPASLEVKWNSSTRPPIGQNIWVSWAKMGDPELLNPDGYIVRWSPWYDSGQPDPIFNYWPGKFANGLPNANLNAYMDFYTDEARHMFRVNESVDRVYHISLPPGNLTVAYAVEACWAPATVQPVTDPLNDFPIEANMPEPYYFRHVVNNNEPITYHPCCGKVDGCENLWAEIKHWGENKIANYTEAYPQPYWDTHGIGGTLTPCSAKPIPAPNDYSYYLSLDYVTEVIPDGDWRAVAVASGQEGINYVYHAYTVFDFTIDLE